MKKSKYIRVWFRKTGRFLRKYLRWMRYLNPLRLLSRLDRYIISKFIGTYIYSIILIISIAIVFDINENLSKFTTLDPHHLHCHRLRHQREPVEVHDLGSPVEGDCL